MYVSTIAVHSGDGPKAAHAATSRCLPWSLVDGMLAMPALISFPRFFPFAPNSVKATAPAEFEQPWIEKYRPQTLTDVVGNEEAVERLNAIAELGNLPNIILCGPPGTGKTTSVLCLARQVIDQPIESARVVVFTPCQRRK